MGSSASISHNNSGEPSCLLDDWLVVELSKKDDIDIETFTTCKDAWRLIENFIGRQVFSDRFFLAFERTDAVACALMSPSRRSMGMGNTRSSLLIYVVRYCLSITDFTFETKKKLRSLGRRHVLSGFTREHFNSFVTAFMSTMLQLHIPQYKSVDLSKAWNRLFTTIIEEMFSEKICLVPRDSSVGWNHKTAGSTVTASRSYSAETLSANSRYGSDESVPVVTNDCENGANSLELIIDSMPPVASRASIPSGTNVNLHTTPVATLVASAFEPASSLTP